MTDNSAPHISPDRNRHEWRVRFLARMTRLRRLLVSKWWVVALGILLGLAGALAYNRFQAPLYASVGRMIVSIKLSIPEGSIYTEELSNFLGTQIALMQSDLVMNRAYARLPRTGTNSEPPKVELQASALPKTTIFVLQAKGQDPEFTRDFLQACMEEYVALKREMRTQTSEATLAGLTEEVLRLKKELGKADDDLAAFQASNSVVLLQEQGNTAGSYLATLNQRLAALQSEHDLLKALTLDQDLERRQQTGNALPTADEMLGRTRPSLDPGEVDYLKAKQQILLLKADREDLSQYLRPKHPKIIALNDEISRREKLLEIFRQQSAEQLDSRKSSLALQIENLRKEVKEWDARNLQISQKTAEYQRLKANSMRVQALYDRLLATMQTLDVNKEISPESVMIMEKACPALPVKTSIGKLLGAGGATGLALAIALLAFINRMDDRLVSSTELQDIFDEELLAQVPREASLERQRDVALVAENDGRHALAEAYRSLRSSLLYASDGEKRPHIFVVTSSVPGEGKSMTSANLAIALAAGGARVLLVDADLRKGVLHERFKLPGGTGFAEALGQALDWKRTLLATNYRNLTLLPRGATSRGSSELLASSAVTGIS